MNILNILQYITTIYIIYLLQVYTTIYYNSIFWIYYDIILYYYIFNTLCYFFYLSTLLLWHWLYFPSARGLSKREKFAGFGRDRQRLNISFSTTRVNFIYSVQSGESSLHYWKLTFRLKNTSKREVDVETSFSTREHAAERVDRPGFLWYLQKLVRDKSPWKGDSDVTLRKLDWMRCRTLTQHRRRHRRNALRRQRLPLARPWSPEFTWLIHRQKFSINMLNTRQVANKFRGTYS